MTTFAEWSKSHEHTEDPEGKETKKAEHSNPDIKDAMDELRDNVETRRTAKDKDEKAE